MSNKIIASLDGNIQFPTEEELPPVSPDKAGTIFRYKGELWSFKHPDDNNGLADGTPWPVKGYKEFAFVVSADTTASPIITKNDGDYEISFVLDEPHLIGSSVTFQEIFGFSYTELERYTVSATSDSFGTATGYASFGIDDGGTFGLGRILLQSLSELGQTSPDVIYAQFKIYPPTA